MIRMIDLSKIYVTRHSEIIALDNVHIEIREGEFIAIKGPPKSGKSTMLNILGLLDSATSGRYIFFDEDVTKYSEQQLAHIRKGSVGFIFRRFYLIDELTVFENVQLPLLYTDLPAFDKKKKVEATLDKMNLMHRRNHFPLQLSSTQQQQVAIARAIVTNPRLILADDPTENLEPNDGEEVLKVLSQLNEEGMTIIMATHSAYNANYAHRTINLFGGKVVTEKSNERFYI